MLVDVQYVKNVMQLRLKNGEMLTQTNNPLYPRRHMEQLKDGDCIVTEQYRIRNEINEGLKYL